MIATVPLPKKLPPMSAGDVREALGRTYSRDAGYLLIHEISVPGNSTRRSDAIALQMYQSRGVGIHGFEIKVDRRDWQNELRDAAKADAVFQRCLTFHVVTPQQLIDPGTLPPGWGLLEVRHSDSRLLTTVKAKPNPDPLPLDLYSVSLILRRAYDFMASPWNEEQAKKVSESYQQGVEAGKRAAASRDDTVVELERLRARVAAFKEASGIDLTDTNWQGAFAAVQPDVLGAAVKFVLEAVPAWESAQRALAESAIRLADLAGETLPNAAALKKLARW